jgi:hypothetical protein
VHAVKMEVSSAVCEFSYSVLFFSVSHPTVISVLTVH